MRLQPRAVQVPPVLHADQIGYLDRIKRTGTMARKHTRRNAVVKGGQLFNRHFANAGQRIRPLPEPRVESALQESGCLDRPSQPDAQIFSELPVTWFIALGALQDRSIRHHAGVTFSAGATANLELSLFAYDEVGKGQHVAFRQRDAAFREVITQTSVELIGQRNG